MTSSSQFFAALLGHSNSRSEWVVEFCSLFFYFQRNNSTTKCREMSSLFFLAGYSGVPLFVCIIHNIHHKAAINKNKIVSSQRMILLFSIGQVILRWKTKAQIMFSRISRIFTAARTSRHRLIVESPTLNIGDSWIKCLKSEKERLFVLSCFWGFFVGSWCSRHINPKHHGHKGKHYCQGLLLHFFRIFWRRKKKYFFLTRLGYEFFMGINLDLE